MCRLLIGIRRQGCLIDRCFASLRKFSTGSLQGAIVLPLPASGSASTMLHMSFPVPKNAAVILLAGLLVTSVAVAGKPKSAGAGRATAEQTPAEARETISKDAAVAMVRERTGGTVVRADRGADKGRTVYRIRVVTAEGRVREYRVDATTGAMY
jgi:hypothetical protein